MAGIVYFATSWSNEFMTPLISMLINGPCPQMPYYDFKTHGFQWDREIIMGRELSMMVEFSEARNAWRRDRDALNAAAALVLILPCGNSAHFEFGYMAGKGKPCAVFMPRHDAMYRLDLVYREADLITYNYEELGQWLNQVLNMPLSSSAATGDAGSGGDRS